MKKFADKNVSFAFSNRESVIRLIGVLLMQIDEKWASGKKDWEMTEYLECRELQADTAFAKVTRIG